jgi:hypothetical protein
MDPQENVVPDVPDIPLVSDLFPVAP